MIGRWWPAIGFAGMLLLGWAVGRGPVPIDDWFQWLGGDMGSVRNAFLVFSEPVVLAGALLIGVIVAIRQQRSRMALAMVASPVVAIAIVQICKRIFGREKGGALAYPSGHTTFLVVVVGLLVLVAGVGLWALVIAVSVSLLGMFGQSITYHYFTDTVGAALLGTAVVGTAAIFARDAHDDQVSSGAPDLR
ncbi:PA-phosphatase [Mycolicibacterium boenickei]